MNKIKSYQNQKTQFLWTKGIMSYTKFLVKTVTPHTSESLKDLLGSGTKNIIELFGMGIQTKTKLPTIVGRMTMK